MRKQLKFNFIAVFLTLSTQIVFLETAFSQHSCVEYFKNPAVAQVYYKADLSYFFHEMRSRFIESPNVIFDSSNKLPSEANVRDFYFSNESDFFRASVDKSEAEVMIGFASNNVWDLAVRKNVKKMIIADWSARPLMVQEYLMKPLLLTAQSPAEFLGFLFLSRSAGQSYLSLKDVFHVIRNSNPNSSYAKLEAESYAEEILQRISADSRFSILHIAMVSEYFKLRLESKPLTGSFVGNWSYKLFDGFIFPAFSSRYDPALLTSRGADPKVIEDPFFSFLSSRQSYNRLQKLFDGNVFYARTEYENVEFYRKLAQDFRAQNYAISISNIIDMANGDIPSSYATKTLRSYLKMLQSNLLSGVEGEAITFFQVRGLRHDHNFQREVITPHTDIDNIRRITSPDEHMYRPVEPTPDRYDIYMGDLLDQVRKGNVTP